MAATSRRDAGSGTECSVRVMWTVRRVGLLTAAPFLVTVGNGGRRRGGGAGPVERRLLRLARALDSAGRADETGRRLVVALPAGVERDDQGDGLDVEQVR